MVRTACVALVLLCPAPVALAQAGGQVVGTVVSGGGQPLPGARVTIRLPGGTDTTLLTDPRGRFRLERAAPGRYSIQAAWSGNQSARNVFDLAARERYEVEFTVGDPAPPPDLEAQPLPDLSTEARPEARRPRNTFESRMATGAGQYLTEQEIVDRNAGTLVDLLRTMRGVRIGCGGRDGCVARMSRAPAGCAPLYFIDDQEADPRATLGLRASDIRGVEVYLGLSQVPGELASDHVRARCGVVAVWTRRGPGRADPPG